MPDLPPLHDYSRSLAVVMGTWEYAFLDPVPAAEHSLRRMSRLLAGPLCGWPKDRIQVLRNVPGPGDLPDLLITEFEPVTDTALFYFVGHGQISPDDQLCLGLVQSRAEPHRRAATSLRFGDVRQALVESSAAVKIVILDCCFAGLATRGTLAGSGQEILDLAAVAGAYTMAATSAYATAWYEDDPDLATPQTYFTKYLADLVTDGIPGQPARLRLDPLFRQLRDNLAVDGRPVPHSRAVNDAREFAFAYNAVLAPPHQDGERTQSVGADPERLANPLAMLGDLVTSLKGSLDNALESNSRALRLIDDALASGAEDDTPDALDPEPGPQGDRSGTGSAVPSSRQKLRLGSRLSRVRVRIALVAAGVAALATIATALLLQSGHGSEHPPAHGTHSVDATSHPSVMPVATLLATLDEPNTDDAWSVAFTSDGSTLLAPGADGNTRLWDISSRKVRAILHAGYPAESDGMLAIAPAGSIIAVGLSNDYIGLWDIATKRRTFTLLKPSIYQLQSIAIASNSNILASGYYYGSTYLWNIADGNVIAKLTNPGSTSVQGIAFGRGNTLAIADGNGNIYLWNITTRKVFAKLTDPGNSGVFTLAISPDGNTLAARAALGKAVYVWNISTRKVISTFVGPDKIGSSAMTFGPGSTLAIADSNVNTSQYDIYIWDYATNKIMTAFAASYWVNSLAFASESSTLAVAQDNGMIDLWRIRKP